MDGKLFYRWISIILLVCMLSGLLPAGAFAARSDEAAESMETTQAQSLQSNYQENTTLLESIGAGSAIVDEYYGVQMV